MRKLYNEFFYIPKHGKVREKVMLARVVTTVVIMIFCLMAMSISAYAYFSHSITSDLITIKAASFYADITVQIIAEDGTVVETIATDTSDPKSHSASLEANKTYTIMVKHNERSTAQTGFVIVTATDCDTKYHTQQLGRDGDGNTYTVTFTLTPSADTVVTFCSHWGTSSFYSDFKEIGENDERYIIDGDDVELTVKSLHVHDYETTITVPTCAEKGYTTYTCACGDNYVSDYVDATGDHVYENDICTVCSTEQSITIQ